MKSIIAFSLLVGSFSSFSETVYKSVEIPVDNKRVKINLGIINQTKDKASIGISIDRNLGSAKKATIHGKFYYEKTKCVEYAEEGWIGKCAVKVPTGKYALKKFSLKVDTKDAVALDSETQENYYIELQAKESVSKDLDIVYSEIYKSQGSEIEIEDNKVTIYSPEEE